MTVLHSKRDIIISPLPDNHKIVFFHRYGENIVGGYLDQRFHDHPDRAIDQLFRWHFRQAVLANMRGAGAHLLESDLPPGSDIVGEILEGPMAAERMEFELFSRLANQDEQSRFGDGQGMAS
ncbi:MAG: hypothetical protein Q9163_005275 [Psora crenata]